MAREELLLVALKKIASVRDYKAEHGVYPEDIDIESRYHGAFDDWAADVASEAIRRYNMMNVSKEDE